MELKNSFNVKAQFNDIDITFTIIKDEFNKYRIVYMGRIIAGILKKQQVWKFIEPSKLKSSDLPSIVENPMDGIVIELKDENAEIIGAAIDAA